MITAEMARALASSDARGLLASVTDQSGNLIYPNAAKALELAILQGSPDLVQTLCDAGVGLVSVGAKDNPVLLTACGRGSPDLIETLLRFGADPEARNDIGQDALMVAAKHGHLEIVTALLAKGMRQTADQAGRTALHWAMTEDDFPKVCALLLKHGWDPNVATLDGKTPKDYARLMKRNLALGVLP